MELATSLITSHPLILLAICCFAAAQVLKVDLKDCLSKDLSILMPLKAEGQKLISLLTGCVGMIMQVLNHIPTLPPPCCSSALLVCMGCDLHWNDSSWTVVGKEVGNLSDKHHADEREG